ncbi:hypothetical protein GCM10023403_05850 [Pseudonocardia benzenivorans]
MLVIHTNAVFPICRSAWIEASDEIVAVMLRNVIITPRQAAASVAPRRTGRPWVTGGAGALIGVPPRDRTAPGPWSVVGRPDASCEVARRAADAANYI